MQFCDVNPAIFFTDPNQAPDFQFYMYLDPTSLSWKIHTVLGLICKEFREVYQINPTIPL
jgi:hypothetical protein